VTRKRPTNTDREGARTHPLSGDLYHTRANRRGRRVPTASSSRADTLASMDRVERIVSNTHARLVVQHDPKDFRFLAKIPRYLD
jgi:N-acyl homoserine lactone hydrolase